MIQRFYVHNFRCLENFELPISKGPSTLLIGRNGSGKSTVMLALEVLQKIARGANRVGDLLKPTDFARGRSDVPLRLEINAILSDRMYEYRLALELPPGFRELRVAEERLSLDGEDVFVRDQAQVELLKPSTGRGASFRLDWHLVALPVIQEQSKEDPLQIFRSWLARILVLAPIPSLVDGDSTDVTVMPDRAMKNFGAWISGLLADYPAAYAEVDRYLKEVMPDLSRIENRTVATSRSLSVYFERDEATFKVPFRNLSDGEKCFFICAVVLAANHVYGPIVCFWDEPDSHLSLSEVGHFVLDLRRSFQSKGQLVITSHNPEAIRRFSTENTFLLQRRDHLEPTLVKPVSEVKVNGGLVDALIRNDLES